MTRRQAEDSVRQAGGEPVGQVSRRTSILVVGMLGWPILPDGTISTKLRRAEQLGLSIVSEADFLERVGLTECRDALHKTYPIEQVEALVGVDAQTLRRWEQFGLIRSIDGRYDYQDLVSLRTLCALMGQGVRLEKIGASLAELSAVLPGIYRPLAQLSLVAECPDKLLAELGEVKIDAKGQLMLDFGERLGSQAVTTSSSARQDAARWFERAQVLEDGELYAEAIKAYQEALVLTADDAVVHFNLANALRAVGRSSTALTHYSRATQLQPALACAWYNLADLKEELGECAGAAECLQQALMADSDYADAHFNLALVYEKLQRPDDAHKHFNAYLQLDPDSEWADCARQHLALAAVERMSV